MRPSSSQKVPSKNRASIHGHSGARRRREPGIQQKGLSPRWIPGSRADASARKTGRARQGDYGTVILPSTTTSPAASRCTTAICPESSWTPAIAWMLVTCETRMVSLPRGDGFQERAAFDAGLAHAEDVGEEHLVEDGLRRDRAEPGELGGVHRAAIEAREQPHLLEAALAEFVADAAGLGAAGVVEVALDRAVLEVHVVGLLHLPRRIGVAKQHNMAGLLQERPERFVGESGRGEQRAGEQRRPLRTTRTNITPS